MLQLTAAEVKDALRTRHPAYEPGMVGIGRWTCIEEWHNIDLLALDAWRSAEVVGYEVKVSRSDMRSELLDPTKRAQGVAMCTRFYFAVPAGMLTEDERSFHEPEGDDAWQPDDFLRARCTNPQCSMRYERHGYARSLAKPRGPKLRGTDREGVSIHLGYVHEDDVRACGTYSYTHQIRACCNVCKGRGTVDKSRVEREAPTLWIPPDVGLVVVGQNGMANVLRQAPARKIPEPIMPWPYQPRTASRLTDENVSRMDRQAINVLVRWVSARPDPRHHNPIRIR